MYIYNPYSYLCFVLFSCNVTGAVMNVVIDFQHLGLISPVVYITVSPGVEEDGG